MFSSFVRLERVGKAFVYLFLLSRPLEIPWQPFLSMTDIHSYGITVSRYISFDKQPSSSPYF